MARTLEVSSGATQVELSEEVRDVLMSCLELLEVYLGATCEQGCECILHELDRLLEAGAESARAYAEPKVIGLKERVGFVLPRGSVPVTV